MDQTKPSTCDDYELAIEMHSRGALGPPETAALEAHLETCVSCEAFFEHTQRLNRSMQMMTAATLGTVRFDEIRAKIQRTARFDRLAVYLALFAPLLQIAIGATGELLVWHHSPDWREWCVNTMACLPIYALLGAFAFRRTLNAPSAALGLEETIAIRRRELRNQLRWYTVSAVAMLPVSFAAWLVMPHYAESVREAHAMSTVLLAYIGLTVVAESYFLFVRGPRLRRELVELGG